MSDSPVDNSARNKKIALGVGAGCLALMFTCCICPIGGSFADMSMRESDAEEAALAWLTSARDGDPRAMYNQMDDITRMFTSFEDFQSNLATRCSEVTQHTTAAVTETRVDHPFDDFVIVRIEISGGGLSAPQSLSMGMSQEDDRWVVGTFSNMDNFGCNL